MMDIQTLAQQILASDRKALAQAITLIESSLPIHRLKAEELLGVLPHSQDTVRIGISGIPGVGKSTFISQLGSWLLSKKKARKIAVLTVDPSSPLEGGSILADKLRMQELARHPDVFIRPSPNLGTLGGLARGTRESIQVLEAAGFETIFVETVGVGQSEVHVASLVDAFVLLQMPSTGDEWQTLKKGILELADLIVVNKADGELKQEALRMKKMLELSFSYHEEGFHPAVLTCSSLENEGVGNIGEQVEHFIARQKSNHQFLERRKMQNQFWFEEELVWCLKEEMGHNPHVKKLIDPLRNKVRKGSLGISAAARRAVELLLH
ncbi:MAG: methylmalonyl Co-A mutase-associated GTPase MeaB [Deltaproteobacteria bacterium]|nr:methylmalonyl Co-A mutase-associated GTPase MeaB [Deltaproteobacteria bacterium]